MGTTLKADGIPKAAIVVDADSGEILWSQQPDLAWNPASIAKVMTMYLAFEAMEQGKFTMDTTVTATQKMSIFLKYMPLVITNYVRCCLSSP